MRLRTTGHAAGYRIYFDTGKSDLKPESELAVGEIGKLLKKEVNPKVYIVGHADNVGGAGGQYEAFPGQGGGSHAGSREGAWHCSISHESVREWTLCPCFDE